MGKAANRRKQRKAERLEQEAIRNSKKFIRYWEFQLNLQVDEIHARGDYNSTGTIIRDRLTALRGIGPTAYRLMSEMTKTILNQGTREWLTELAERNPKAFRIRYNSILQNAVKKIHRVGRYSQSPFYTFDGIKEELLNYLEPLEAAEKMSLTLDTVDVLNSELCKRIAHDFGKHLYPVAFQRAVDIRDRKDDEG